MEKNEKMILEAFVKTKTPQDFNTSQLIMLVDCLCGLISRALKNEKLSRNEVGKYLLDDENKNEISRLLSKNIDNLIYYNQIKTCFLILTKNSV